MSEEDKYPYLKLLKEISASITIFFCFILIVTYFISFLQVKFDILIKKDLSNEVSRDTRCSQNSFLEKSGLSVKENEKQTKKIGLGSHFMLLLILSQFFGGIVELIYLLIDEDYRTGDNEDEKLECQLFGFFHNFFDLSSVCWTTMLTYLFYKSTNLSSEILYNDTKYLVIGFLYWFFSCFIFVVIPLIEKEYGFSSSYCAFRRKKKGEKGIELLIWILSFIIIVLINNIYNCICLYKTTKFYSAKLKVLKNQNEKEYNLVYIYVKVFQIFPIVLVITRIFKSVSVFLLIALGDEDLISKIFIYLNGFSFNINGALNSLACIYFFRGVFWCCFSTPDNKSENLNINIIEKNESNVLYE